jgi:hypothetical protein
VTAVAEDRDDRPRPGDRVKLCGCHAWAGHNAIYVCDRGTPSGATKPIVRILSYGVEAVVMDPESQMRKA